MRAAVTLFAKRSLERGSGKYPIEHPRLHLAQEAVRILRTGLALEREAAVEEFAGAAVQAADGCELEMLLARHGETVALEGMRTGQHLVCDHAERIEVVCRMRRCGLLRPWIGCIRFRVRTQRE